MNTIQPMAAFTAEDRFQALIENAFDVITVLSAEGIILYQSPSAEHISGYRPEEFIGKSALTLVHPDDRERIRDVLDDLLSHREKAPRLDFRIRHRDGSWRYLQGSGRNLVDHPAVRGIVFNGRDVTSERREAERKQLLSEAGSLLSTSLRYEDILERLGQLAVKDLADLCVVDLLQEGSLHRMVAAHHDADQASVARRLVDRYAPGPQPANPILQVLESGEPQLLAEISDELLRKVALDAEHLRVLRQLDVRSAILVPLRIRDEVIGVLSLSTSGDSERVLTAQDLEAAQGLATRAALAIDNARLYRESRESEQRFRAIFERSALGICLVNPQGHTLDLNPAAESILGHSLAEVHGRPIQTLVHPEDRAHKQQLMQELLDGDREHYETEERYIRKDGEIVWVRASVTCIRDQAGVPQYLVGLVNDVTQQRNAHQEREELLHRLEAERGLFSAVLEQMPAGLMVAEAPSGRLIISNPRIEEILGHGFIAADSVAGYEAYRGYHPEDGREIAPEEWPLARALQGEVVIDWEFEYAVSSTSARKLLRASAAPVRDREQRITAAIVTFHDVTERNRMQATLDVERERFRRLIENASDAFFVHDREGHILSVNQQACSSLGYAREELMSMRVWDFDQASTPENAADLWQDILHSHTPVTVEGTHRRKDGTTIPVEIRIGLFEWEDEPLFLALVRDVSERKETEARLRESEERFHMLADNAQAVFWITSADKREFIYVSPGYESVWGRDRDALYRRWSPLPEGMHPDDAEDYLAAVPKQRDGTYDEQYRIIRPDGSIRWIRDRAYPVRDEQGSLHHIVGVAVDITDLKQVQVELLRAKEEAEAANRSKSDFLASMSHELRTPLNSVIGFTNVLLQNRDGRFHAKDLMFLERVRSNGRHLLELINDILDLSKIEAGKMEVEIGDVMLEDLVRDTAAQLEGRLIGKPVELKIEVQEIPLTPARTDEDRFRQILINLMGNAIKFTSEGSVTVRITATADGRPAAVEVIDTGIGIPEERQEAIFNAFEQAEAGTARNYEGTGLGLAICRSICDLLGHYIEVESESGVGSTFRIVLEG